VVRAFLGLAGYYCCFIRNFGGIASPLTKLLCMEHFMWNEEAKDVFHALQHDLTSASVLCLPTFNKDFVAECNASRTGIRVVLHQGEGVVAFFSQ
jgi:hypothetical protein